MFFDNLTVFFADNKFNSIGPIYYEYGSMVITYEDAAKAVRALYALREAKYEDKHLLGKCRNKTTISYSFSNYSN